MQPVDVHIHTNTNCNLRCRHCYVDAGTQGIDIISEDFEIKLISFLSKNFNADIHLEGGEIFLEEHLIRALLYLDVHARKNITITSNGLLRTQNDDTINALRSISCLRISVEGHTDELHKMIRGCDLRTVLENARYYKEMGINVVLRITLNVFNMDIMFAEVIPALIEEGFNNFQIYEMQAVGRGRASGICIKEPLCVFFEDWIKHPPKANVTCSLPKRRISEAKLYLTELYRVGVRSLFVGNAASINVGVDGSVNICPWNMNSNAVIHLDGNNFNKLFDIINCQEVPHECEFCTRMLLKASVQC